MAKYLHDWAARGEPEMLEDFGIDKEKLDGAEVVVASYTYANYEGDAFVLFKRDGKLFEVNGSHCSCYGLNESDYTGKTSTQWEPEETSLDAIRPRLSSGWFNAEVAEAIREALPELVA